MKSRPRKPRKRFLFVLVVINMECYVVTCSDGKHLKSYRIDVIACG